MLIYEILPGVYGKKVNFLSFSGNLLSAPFDSTLELWHVAPLSLLLFNLSGSWWNGSMTRFRRQRVATNVEGIESISVATKIFKDFGGALD